MLVLLTGALVFLAIVFLVVSFSALGKNGRAEAIRRRLGGDDTPEDALDSTIFRQERMSSIGPVNRILSQLHMARKAERLLAQAGMSLKVSNFFFLSLVAGIVAGYAAMLVLHEAALALLAFTGAGLLPLVVVLGKRSRRMKLFSEQFPDALDMIVNALRAGFALGGAIQMVAEEAPEPVATEFRILFEEQKLGLDVRQAMLNFADRNASTDAAIFATAVMIQRDTGGNLAEVLEKIAYVIRDRYRILGDVRTFTAQGRLSGFILALLPIFLGITISIISPGYMDHLFEDPLGSVLITVAVVLQVVGFLTIRKIVNFKV
jgi:tight adherence protein B